MTPNTLQNKISILPEAVANKIAAGEVVERPASVVKELVENALDAGATEIEVIVKHGGLGLIRVSDNGSGMSGEDARLSLVRYATSKIRTVEDIFRINTFGFRGEALPSIAAVSRFRLLTRLQGSPSGVEIEIEGGKILSEKQAGMREGTVIEIRDLFFNTPARRKFLKAERTELSHLTEAITLIALANPRTHFILKHETETLLDVPKTSDLRQRIRALYDDEFESRLVAISGELPGVRISGFVGKPELVQTHRRDQKFFVNQRPVKSLMLGFALTQAFHGLVMDGRHPVGIIFLEINPDLVDVNVHPTKREVRLSNERAIQNFLVETIRRHVLSKDLFPEMPVKQPSAVSYQLSAETNFHADSVKEPMQEIFDYGSSTSDAPADVLADSYKLTADSFLREIRVLGQIHASYLIGEYPEGLVIIDQHAAHERVQFEIVLRSLTKAKVESQGLLMPVILKLTAQEELLLQDALDLLGKVGFQIESFGPRTYAIQSIPAFVEDGDIEGFIKGYLERRGQFCDSPVAQKPQEEIAALIACKRRSVKAGDRMALEEIEALVESLQKAESPFTCPHGRPTILKVTREDLEKHFKRK